MLEPVKTLDKEGNLIIFYDNGVFESYNIKGMITPVKCNYCGKVYDLTNTKAVARYADCTTYLTPCCNNMADDKIMGSSFTAINLKNVEHI